MLPGPGSSTFQTAPTPVWTPQPSGAIVSRGAEGSTLTTLRSSATAMRANDDWPKKWPPSGSPSRVMVADPSRRAPPIRLSGSQVAQYAGCPPRQLAQPPHEVNDSRTWSPGATDVTAEPTRSTTPAPSWPSTPGSGNGSPPEATPRSVWHRPAAVIRTRTSSARGSSSSTSARVKGAPPDSTTAAWVVMVMGVLLYSGWGSETTTDLTWV